MVEKNKVSDCNLCKFRLDCIYNQLTTEAQKKWLEIRTSLNFSDKENIYSEGDKPCGIYIVCAGRVKISTNDFQDQQLITWIRHPAEMFGHFALFSQREFTCNAEAMGNTVISFIEGNSFKVFMKCFLQVYDIMLKKMAIENTIMQLKLKDTAYKPAKAKIAHTLIKHISFKTKNTPTPTIYGLKRTEIAELTGVALETVVRCLSDLEKRKIIKRASDHIKILDYNCLQKISNQ